MVSDQNFRPWPFRDGVTRCAAYDNLDWKALGIDMDPIAQEYEKEHGVSLQGFFDSSMPKLQHPQIQSWGEDLLIERKSLRQEGKKLQWIYWTCSK